MPLPADLSVYGFTCEKALREADGVTSAIRLVDVFSYASLPNIPLEQQAVAMNVVAAIRSSTLSLGHHTIRLDLVRPDGERKAGAEIIDAEVEAPKFPPAPHGVNLIVHLGVIPKQDGVHQWVLLFDDEEVLRIPFTLRPMRPPETV